MTTLGTDIYGIAKPRWSCEVGDRRHTSFKKLRFPLRLLARRLRACLAGCSCGGGGAGHVRQHQEERRRVGAARALRTGQQRL